MPKRVIVFLAEGFEEVEAVTPIDYLRRAGVEVTTAAVGRSRTVTGSHGIPLLADKTLQDIPPGDPSWDALILPGGLPGAANLAASAGISSRLRAQAEAGKIIAAICAAPAVVLAPLGLLKGRHFTCYPDMETQVGPEAIWTEAPVVADGNIITSRGAGTAALFAKVLIGQLVGEAAADRIMKSVLI
jgi:4-methyl-5(b-hydroxyethyl)-thiazole monophosphate biosynthesis